MFLTTQNGCYINLDHVREITTSSHKRDNHYDYSAHITFTDGSTDTYQTYAMLDPREHTPSLVPAYPGFTLLAFYKHSHDDEPSISRSPIIAWAIDTELSEYHKPFALEPPAANAIGSAILQPNGTLVDPGCASWINEQAWYDEMLKTAKLQNAEKSPPQTSIKKC